ncbi:tetratricopeptide repeat protein [Micromonospora lupini]|uniref:Tetratricopeptide repeat protein n=1 Tax=Micromonospora lupini str. Lupac 08 TaxID=1150864 RepID=I0L1Y2_9ACTN|nr:tetratricopeptide repeat protein [Micromonospora lupini]CCH17829.1 hypothetical protein MILUP08_42760 [Micromonospora lupini str. Lupac 08]
MLVSGRLIAALTRRIRAFEQGDPGAVLDRQALIECDELLGRITDADGGDPFDAMHVVAWLRWCRYLALPEGDDREDLRAAVELFTPIADIDPQAVPEPVRRYLGGLAERSADLGQQALAAFDLLQRVMHSDNPVALNQAIELLTTAVAATPTDHPNRAAMLSNLSGALQTRFGRTGSSTDLDEAVTAGREAVAATPEDNPIRAMMLSNLSAALQTRFGRTDSSTDLDEAITASREAVAATPTDHPDHAGYLSNLGSALQARFRRTGSSTDLDRGHHRQSERRSRNPRTTHAP